MLATLGSARRAIRAEVVILHEVLIIVALVLLNGVLAGAEIALVSVRKTRIDELVDEARAGARAIKRLRKQPERFLATVQIGITVVGATAGAYGGSSIADKLDPVLAEVPWIGDSSDEVALALVVGAISFLSLVLGELVPKSLALRVSERYALLISRPLLLLSQAMRPVVWLLTASSNLVLRVFGDSTSFTEARLSPGEIQQIVDEATETGSVEPVAGEIASRAIDFADLTAGQIMVPRRRIVAIPRSASTEEVRRIVLEHGHMRMPVYHEVIDDVVGYVTLRDLMAVFVEKDLLVLEDALRPAYVVPESTRAVELLTEMRKRRLQLAVVVDEDGATSGIVTIEDLVEELVGDIASEHDPIEEHSGLVREPSGCVLVRGDFPLHELNRELELELPESEAWTTIAGLTIELAGRIPRGGDRVVAPDGTTIVVVAATPKQIARVRIVPAAERSDDDDDDGAA